MKLNVYKMQEGGAVGSPTQQAYGFLDYVPVMPQAAQVAGGNATGASPTSAEAPAILSDDMIKALLGKGLTNDVNAFMSAVNSMYSNPLEGNPFGSSINSQDLARKQYTLISRINQIQNNKDLFTKAIDTAKESGGLNELAITNLGRIVAVDNENGGIRQITPDELYQNRDSYTPLTNADIAEMRMNNPSLAFDTNTFNIIGNAVGSDQVDKFIRTAINEANKMSTENNIFRSREELDEVKNGLKALQKGIYKEKNLTETNVNQINSAINYLYRALPANYKAFLQAKAASMGLDPKQGMADMISDYAGTKQSLKTVRDISYDTAATKGAEGTGTSKDKIDNTPFMALYNGQGAIRKPFELNPGSEFQMKVTGLHLNAIPDQNGNIVPAETNLRTVLDKGLGALTSEDAVYMGGQKIKPTDLDKILYTGGGVTRVEMPVKDDGTPDFDMIKRYETAKNIISSNPDMTPEEIKEVFETNGVGTYVLPDGELDESKFKSFFILNGAGSEEQGVLNDEIAMSGLVKPIKSELPDKTRRKNFQRTFMESTSNRDAGIIYNPGDDIYFGTIFIEDTGSSQIAGMANKSYLKLPGRSPYEQSAFEDTQEKALPTGSDILGI